jgi:hypothetical protein
MWLRLQARRFHARLPRRRPFPSPSQRTFHRVRGYSRSHTGTKSFRPNPRLQPRLHLLSFQAPSRKSFRHAARPMWLRLQARKIHDRLPRRRPFPSPSRRTFHRVRGYSRSHTGAKFFRPNPRLKPQPHRRVEGPSGTLVRAGRKSPNELRRPALPLAVIFASLAPLGGQLNRGMRRTHPAFRSVIPPPSPLTFRRARGGSYP